MEISPNGDLMLARITYNGDDENGIPILDIDYVPKSFVKVIAEAKGNAYSCSLEFSLNDIMTGDGEIFFNCYRIDTEGGTPDRHLFALNPTRRRRFHTPKYYLSLKDFV